MSFAGIVLIDGNKHRRAGTGDVGGTHRVTGSLRGDHDDIDIFRRDDAGAFGVGSAEAV